MLTSSSISSQTIALSSLHKSFFDACGHSESGWTPAMFRLQELIVDDDKSELHVGTFTPHNDELDKTIYSFAYIAGTVRQ